MEVAFWIAQGIGVIGFVLSILIYQVNERRKMLNLRILASATLGLHFLFLAAPTGAALDGLSAVRTYIFRKRTEAAWADHRGWLFGFLVLCVIVTAATWEGYRSLLPLWGLIFGTLTFWSKSPQTIRWLSLLPSPAWIVYDWIVGSYPGIVIELFILSSAVVGIARFDTLKKEQDRLPR